VREAASGVGRQDRVSHHFMNEIQRRIIASQYPAGVPEHPRSMLYSGTPHILSAVQVGAVGRGAYAV